MIDDTNLLNTKMVEFLESPEHVRWEQQRLIRGGAGYSGIAVIVCVFVMNKDQSLIVTLICVKQHQTLQQTSMLMKTFMYGMCID